jgi:hypothetical protein
MSKVLGVGVSHFERFSVTLLAVSSQGVAS